MTAIASDDTPEPWSHWDDIAVEVYSHLDNIERLSDINALVFFTDQLFANEQQHTITLDPSDAHILNNFLTEAITVDTIIQKYFGPNYVDDYIETIETEDNDEQH